MVPELKWNKQFEIMKEKKREAIGNLKNEVVFAATAHVFLNMCLIKEECLRCGTLMATPK